MVRIDKLLLSFAYNGCILDKMSYISDYDK